MSPIGPSIGIAVSTATGIVDNLVRKGLVMRGADSEYRCLVISTLSSKGQETINRLWALHQFQIEKLLRGLSLELFKKADEVAEFLHHNMTTKNTSSS